MPLFSENKVVLGSAVGILKVTITAFLVLALVLVSFPQKIEASDNELLIFKDNFENYSVGIFPSVGGWEMWFNGAGREKQVIVNDAVISSTKILKLLGLDNWAGYAAKPFDSNSPIIGFEVSVKVQETNGQSKDNARVAFSSRVNTLISTEYAPVKFQDKGIISSGGQVLQSYLPNTWYKIKQVLNKQLETYSIWIDGILMAENLSVTTTSGESSVYPSTGIEAFSVSQCYNNVNAYFDNVEVFSIYNANPKLELQPSLGIAQTTLVGSGFAPNSKITVTWNGTKLHSVPEPLIVNNNGDFTAIVSVLNQTFTGDYKVTAIDELGNEATNIFTVIPEFSSWIPLLISGLFAAFLMSIIYRQRVIREGVNEEK